MAPQTRPMHPNTHPMAPAVPAMVLVGTRCGTLSEVNRRYLQLPNKPFRMKRQAVYWIIALALTGLWGFQTWQHRQEQRQTALRLRLLDATLQVANERARDAAARTVWIIADNTAKNRNQARDIFLLQTSRQLHYRADSAVRQLEALRNTAVPGAVAARARQLLQQYTSVVRPLLIGESARPGGGLPDTALVFREASNRPAWFQEFMSTEVSVLLTQTMQWVRQLEAQALYLQAQKSGSNVDSFFKVGAFAAAESNVVSAGEKYKAVLFLGASATGLNPKMEVNGIPIEVLSNGQGQVEFVVPATAARAKVVTAHWDGVIRARLDTQDVVFRLRVPYTIRPKR